MAVHRTAATALASALTVGGLLLSGCSDTTTDTPAAAGAVESDPAGSETGVRLVTPEEGAAIQEDAPSGLVVLDIRTPEEFAEGHLEDAILVDFYDADFTEQLAALDPDVPYLLYCRSGNRSGQAAVLMDDLGFMDVANIDGGIVAWAEGGFEVVSQ